MDTSALIAALRAAAERVTPSPPQPLVHPAWRFLDAVMPPTTHDAVIPLFDLLAAEPALAIFDDTMMRHCNGASRVSFLHLVQWLLWRATETSAETAIADLEAYVARGTLSCFVVRVLGGVTLPAPVSVTPTITLLPWSEVPTTWEKSRFERGDALSLIPKPTAALVAVIEQPAAHGENVQGSLTANDLLDLEDVRRCITLIGPCAPIALGWWAVLLDNIPCSHEGATVRASYPQYPGMDRWLGPETHGDLRAVCEAFVALPQDERAQLRISLDRLNSAMRHPDRVNVAIDLGIAAEAFFLSDQEEERGEQTYRLSVRAARYLGTDTSSRRELRRFFQDLYWARSSAVHTGTLKEWVRGRKAKGPTTDLLSRGLSEVATALRRRILNGKPDWDDVVLR